MNVKTQFILFFVFFFTLVIYNHIIMYQMKEQYLLRINKFGQNEPAESPPNTTKSIDKRIDVKIPRMNITSQSYPTKEQHLLRIHKFGQNETAESPPKITQSIDKRIGVKRPRMEITSHSFLDSIHAIERKYKPSSECSAFGGSKFMEQLINSTKSLLRGGKSSILSFRNKAMDIYVAENVTLLVSPPSEENQERATFELEVDGTFLDDDAKSRMVLNRDDETLKKMTIHVRERIDGIPECTDTIEYPVMLVDSEIDTWNWWWFLISLLKHYISVAVAQPHVAGDYEQDLRVMYAMKDKLYSRSFVDAFEFMFSDRRGRDSRQVWQEQPIQTIVSNDNRKTLKRYCFSKLLWSPGGSQGGNQILINRLHGHSACFSSIVYSYAAYMKAALHIPTLPRPEKPLVVWVGRDTSREANPTKWQKNRIIDNQDKVIAYLRDQCSKIGVDLIVADFYGEKKDTAFQEQALFVARANIMIGIHGAGLNLFHFMPFNSVLIEIHMGTKSQKNLANFINHIKEGKYISMDTRMKGGKNLDEKLVWNTLNQSISEWGNLV